jgi:hypothetical protein
MFAEKFVTNNLKRDVNNQDFTLLNPIKNFLFVQVLIKKKFQFKKN